MDSALHHTSELDREADQRRDAQFEDAGFRVVRITDHLVWHRPREAVAKVRNALASPAA